MAELDGAVLDNIEIGIILTDSRLNIVFWNKYIERISMIKRSAAINRKLSDVCSVFAKQQYQVILHNALEKWQCRFCSSKLHEAFVFPRNAGESDRRQNMIVQPVISGNSVYILIQIFDITYQVSSEQSLASIISKIEKGYMEIKESEELNRKLAQTDPLTGLMNRMALRQQVGRILSQEGSKEQFSLMFLDIDNFKQVNDTYGHIAGDRLLVQIGAALKGCTRGGDLVSRFGGDEFIIVIRTLDGIGGALAAAKKISDRVAKPVMIEDQSIAVTASIGVAMFDSGDAGPDAIIRRADMAMYEAKRNGKNAFEIYKQVRK